MMFFLSPPNTTSKVFLKQRKFVEKSSLRNAAAFNAVSRERSFLLFLYPSLYAFIHFVLSFSPEFLCSSCLFTCNEHAKTLERIVMHSIKTIFLFINFDNPLKLLNFWAYFIPAHTPLPAQNRTKPKLSDTIARHILSWQHDHSSEDRQKKPSKVHFGARNKEILPRLDPFAHAKNACLICPPCTKGLLLFLPHPSCPSA